MIPTIAVLLGAQLIVAAPDTTLFDALVRAVDTAATSRGRVALRGGTFLVDIDYFSTLTGESPDAAMARLPRHWRSYDQFSSPCREAATPCVDAGEVRVMISQVARNADGTVLIGGSFVYHREPMTPLPGERTPRGASSSVGFRNFGVVLAREGGVWRVRSVDVNEAA